MSWHQPENDHPTMGLTFQQHPGGPIYYQDLTGRLSRMKVEFDSPSEEHEFEYGEPMEVEVTPNYGQPVQGLDPENKTPKYWLNVDPNLYSEAINERLPRNKVGLTLGVSHVLFKFRVAKNGSGWHCERCHFEQGFDDTLFVAKTIHNVQPGGVSEAIWDSRCPLPHCGRQVAHRKDVADCARCSEILVLNSRLVNELNLTLCTEAEVHPEDGQGPQYPA